MRGVFLAAVCFFIGCTGNLRNLYVGKDRFVLINEVGIPVRVDTVEGGCKEYTYREDIWNGELRCGWGCFGGGGELFERDRVFVIRDEMVINIK